MLEKRPILGLLLMGLAFVVTLAFIDLIRTRKWFASAAPVDESQCTWSVTFHKAAISPFEWPVLFNWLHDKMKFDVVNSDTINVTLDNDTKQALDQFGGARGWKYKAVRQCPPQA